MKQIVVHKGRTTILPVSLGTDVSGDTFSSQIRSGKNRASTLIAAWDISFDTDGTDGELVLTLDDSVSATITNSIGYMDLKRTTDGEPLNVFDEPLEVIFKETITE